MWVLQYSSLVIILLQIWSIETVLHRDDEYSIKKNKLYTSARSAAFIYRDYIYGAVVNLTVLEVVKCVVGSPRPTFFDLCEPDKARTCNGLVLVFIILYLIYSTYIINV